MARDRDSPIEQTGQPHLVTTACTICGDQRTVAAVTAEAAAGVYCPACLEAAYEIAYVEHALRQSRAVGVDVQLGPGGARLRFETAAGDRKYRARLVATVTTAVATTDAWRVGQIHDPLPLESRPHVESLLTCRRTDRDPDEAGRDAA